MASALCRLTTLLAVLALGAPADDESLIFTPAGFSRPGVPRTTPAEGNALVELEVVDDATGKPTPCRVNVVGPDGNFHQPAENRLSLYSLTGDWPKVGKGNRAGKAPIRYFGRFFYITGTSRVAVPPGRVRVEVWKGLEFAPVTRELEVAPGSTTRVNLRLKRTVDMAALGLDSGDPHLHFRRASDEDDAIILDLLEAEDIRFGTPLGYNEPAGPYNAVRETLDYPQLRGLGARSERARGAYRILSGQEYRSSTYGHLNLFLRDDLVREGESYNADTWPAHGLVGRETKARGGFAIHAHGGYGQEIYADFVQGDIDAVELLQFGVYRGIGLDDWYHILNAGFRLPAVGASDYPACRKLGDCVSYVERPIGKPIDTRGWLGGAAAGRSFVTTAPLLILKADERRPGDVVNVPAGGKPRRVAVDVRVVSPVAPVQHVQVIVNGRVVKDVAIPLGAARSEWYRVEHDLELAGSCWVAARAFGTASTGSPDAEAHTNPVYFHVGGKAPHDQPSLDAIVARIDAQMTVHRGRSFAEKSRILDYFQKSRDILLRIRREGGLPSDGVPRDWLRESSAAFDPSLRAHTEAELADFLKPLPPKTPAESLASFETAPGLHMELVASEPLVHSPVAAAFDENGQLYVAEMIDYPFKAREGQKPLGTVRVLRDRDGDGKYDESHVFADGLLWAAGIAPWKGGVYVASPPDIWYLKDTDGDLRADVRRKIYTGFGTQNEQGMLNNLIHGIDHKIYGSGSVNGGRVLSLEQPNAAPVALDGKDFRFDPVSGRFEATSGTLQFGTTFDDFGNRFLCSESRPLIHAVLPLDALARNPYLPVPSALEDVAGHPVPIFRISPLERWRQIRSSRRIAHGERAATSAGASHHVIDAAAGVTVYRGTALSDALAGNAFVCDAQNNLIHRLRLEPNGPTFRARRVEEGSEFVRSYDNWFRPVNLVNAPDGTLHVLDMSREIIEAIHIPLDVMKHLDLRRGREQGRIYRIAPVGFRPKPPPRLGSADTATLVATLEHPDGWHRDTAHRLIHERQDRAAVEPLRALLRGSKQAPARALALWSLEGLTSLTDSDLAIGLRDTAPGVARQALRLASSRVGASRETLDLVVNLADSDDAGVRMDAALCLGDADDPAAIRALARIARGARDDRWTRTAVLCASAASADRLFATLLEEKSRGNERVDPGILQALAGVVGARKAPDSLTRALESLADARGDVLSRSEARALLLSIAQGLGRSNARLDPAVLTSPRASAWVTQAIEEAITEANDPRKTENARGSAIALLGLSTRPTIRATLEGLLQPEHPTSVQIAAIRALANAREPGVAALILDHYRAMGPLTRAEAVAALLAREAWTQALLDAATKGQVESATIDLARQNVLRNHKNPDIANRARKLFGAGDAQAPGALLASFAPALKLAGDVSRGRLVYERLCMTCHKVGDKGKDVGPDLTATQFGEPESLLTHVIEPNRYVAPNHVQYVVSDKGGRVYTGMIASETASSLTLRRAEGAEDTILRNQIEEIASTGKSLMPEDLASKLTHQEAADLVAFILGARRPGAVSERLDIGTLPGLIEPDR